MPGAHASTQPPKFENQPGRPGRARRRRRRRAGRRGSTARRRLVAGGGDAEPVTDQPPQGPRRTARRRPRSCSRRSSSRRCRTARLPGGCARRPPMTPATSPSPKLDSTPACATSASGQSWRTMPLMNVPWPPSKSRNPPPSSSGSSSSSMRLDGRVALPVGVDAGRCPAGAGARRSGPRRRRRCAGRCRGRGPAAAARCARFSRSAKGGGSGAGSHVEWRNTSPLHLTQLGREHHPAGEVGLGADGAAGDALAGRA